MKKGSKIAKIVFRKKTNKTKMRRKILKGRTKNQSQLFQLDECGKIIVLVTHTEGVTESHSGITECDKKVLPLAHLEKTYHTCDTKQVLLSRRSRESCYHGKPRHCRVPTARGDSFPYALFSNFFAGTKWGHCRPSTKLVQCLSST